ncbi:hypothetical protein [Salipiger aestuarii]|uniref:hypothetical protein n=1 Tax=Salipiger aestuarii TaxID=568098 RepID=UPI00123B4976|nr:hypothetical protein [Salipiger aestuarii]
MTQVFLHIGDMKTGTTSIQRALMRGSWSGVDQTLCYPVTEGHPYHHPLGSAIHRGDKAAVAQQMSAIYARIKKSGADVAVISTELLEEVPAVEVMRVMRDHLGEFAEGLKVIAYVRPHAERVLSSWVQVTKLGLSFKTQADFYGKLAPGKLAYADRFGAWRDLIGDRFVLRPMIRAELAGGDVVQDFLEIVFGSQSVEAERDLELNESLSLSDLVLLRHLHKHPRRMPQKNTRGARMRMGEYLSYILSAMPRRRDKRPMLSRELYERIRQERSADADALDKAFFSSSIMSDALVRAAEKTVPAEQPLEAADYFSADQIRHINAFSILLHDMVKFAPEVMNVCLTQKVYATMRESVWAARDTSAAQSK